MDHMLHWHQRRNGGDLEFMANFGELWGKTNTRVALRRGSGVALTSKKEWRWLGICSQIWRALGQPKNTAKVTLRHGTGVALTLSVVHVDQLSQKTVRRLNKHNSCPASVCIYTCSIQHSTSYTYSSYFIYVLFVYMLYIRVSAMRTICNAYQYRHIHKFAICLSFILIWYVIFLFASSELVHTFFYYDILTWSLT